MGNAKERFIRSKGSSSYEFVWWCKGKNESGICVFIVIRKVGVYQRSVLSPLLFAIAVDVIIEKARRGVVNELLYVDNLVLMSETMKDLIHRFWNWKDALESKGLKVDIRKTKVVLSGLEGELFKSKINA